MATANNSTMEMGTSDQVLVSAKRKKTLTYAIAGVAMVVVLAAVVTLVVLLSGNEGVASSDNGTAEAIVTSTTEGPTTSEYSTTTEATTTTTSTTTVAPVTDPPVTGSGEIELNDIISGAYSASSFNGSWVSGNEIMFRTATGDLALFDVTTTSTTILLRNDSEILLQSQRVSLRSPDGAYVALSYNIIPVYRYSFLGRYAAINIQTGTVIDITPPGIEADQAFLQNFVWGPEGNSCAFVYLNNIYYKSNLIDEAVQLTANGVLNVVYNGIPDWVYEEEIFTSNNALWFSRDGSRMAYVTFDDSAVRIMRVPHYGVPGSVNYQYTAHHEIRYPKPGTTNPTVSVTLLNVDSRSSVTYNAPSTELAEPILKTVAFVTNTSVALLWSNRVQNSIIVQLCQEGTAACTNIYSYSEPEGWIDNIPLIFNDAGTAFITILPQEVDERMYKQVVEISNTNNVWSAANRVNISHTVLEILQWTSDNVIWYKATAASDSSEQHIYTASASGVSCFSCDITRPDGAPCLYNEASISSDGSTVAVNCAGPSVPQTIVYTNEGYIISVWESNEELSALTTGRNIPETIRLSVPVAEGYPDADVHIQVPSDYASRTNVPLLVYVYGGPDTALVTKQWTVDWGTSLVNRWGIAVATIDGRGSGLRGLENTFAVNRRLGTVEIEDQINVTRYLQQNLPWLDSNRTCIWGWSYGGYAASMALARGGDVFRCAIAVAPVTDWRFYDTMYTERYMDIPENNTAGYTESSLISESVATAFRDKRYFLVHGSADDNVHYQHSMLISRLLQRRDVYFTQMSYTDEDHGLGGVRPHLYHGLERFLTDNML